jgi:hypothetical protein
MDGSASEQGVVVEGWALFDGGHWYAMVRFRRGQGHVGEEVVFRSEPLHTFHAAMARAHERAEEIRRRTVSVG